MLLKSLESLEKICKILGYQEPGSPNNHVSCNKRAINLSWFLASLIANPNMSKQIIEIHAHLL